RVRRGGRGRRRRRGACPMSDAPTRAPARRRAAPTRAPRSRRARWRRASVGRGPPSSWGERSEEDLAPERRALERARRPCARAAPRRREVVLRLLVEEHLVIRVDQRRAEGGAPGVGEADVLALSVPGEPRARAVLG